jgi:hypothetical protein
MICHNLNLKEIIILLPIIYNVNYAEDYIEVTTPKSEF